MPLIGGFRYHYLILEEALEEIASQEPSGGLTFVKCRSCSASVSSKEKNKLRHKEDCPVAIAARALAKVHGPIDNPKEQE